MPQRAPVPRLARRPTDHRGSADRLQPSPAAYEPSRSHPERVCNLVHQGPYGAQSPIMSEGITGATSRLLGLPGVIAFERFDEGLCHAVALRTLEWGEAGFEVERQRDLDGFVSRRLN